MTCFRSNKKKIVFVLTKFRDVLFRDFRKNISLLRDKKERQETWTRRSVLRMKRVGFWFRKEILKIDGRSISTPYLMRDLRSYQTLTSYTSERRNGTITIIVGFKSTRFEKR